jgi:hypothetical protein
MIVQREVEALNVKVIKYSIGRLSQPSRDRCQQPIAGAIENFLGTKKSKSHERVFLNEPYNTSHPQGMGGTSFCSLSYTLNFDYL